MKGILVTGSDGQLGSALKEAAHNNNQFSFSYMDIHDLDLTDDESVRKYFQGNRFDYIINCAAYTAVDQAEKQKDKAFALNAGVPKRLGAICLNGTAHLIHFSTDYVYDGNRNVPHLEQDQANPVSDYAQSKLDGEKSLWDNPNAMIIRTSWLYSEFGNNFLKTMIRLMNERTELGVVFDQVGTPTYAGDLAEASLAIIHYSEKNGFKPGIYNYSNEGVCSWFDFATEIKNLTGSKCNVKPIRTNEYPLPARRPAFGVMDKNKIKRTFELKIPYWRDSLILAINKLNQNKAV